MEDQDIVRVHVIVPEGFDDSGQPTGGNIYDRRVCAGLAEAGWEGLGGSGAAAWRVRGPGPRAGLAGAGLARVLAAIPDGETVLIDGLIASPAAAQLLPHTGRLRLTVLLHMPLTAAADTDHDADAERSERAVLQAAAAVVVTSEWTQRQVLTRYAIPACRAYVGRPGADRGARPARPRPGPPPPPPATATGTACWSDRSTATRISSNTCGPGSPVSATAIASGSAAS